MKFKKHKDCLKCPLNKNEAVWGIGTIPNDIMVIGRDPGEEENKFKKPFIGKSGKLLTLNLGLHAGIRRELIYITNVVKCHPPKNRPHTEEEARLCKKFLLTELKHVKPKLIILLGNKALQCFFKNKTIGKARGKLLKDPFKNIYFYPMYHPSYIERNKSKKPDYIKNFEKLKKIVNKYVK